MRFERVRALPRARAKRGVRAASDATTPRRRAEGHRGVLSSSVVSGHSCCRPSTRVCTMPTAPAGPPRTAACSAPVPPCSPDTSQRVSAPTTPPTARSRATSRRRSTSWVAARYRSMPTGSCSPPSSGSGQRKGCGPGLLHLGGRRAALGLPGRRGTVSACSVRPPAGLRPAHRGLLHRRGPHAELAARPLRLRRGVRPPTRAAHGVAARHPRARRAVALRRGPHVR